MAGSSKRRDTGGEAPIQRLLEQALFSLDMGGTVREQQVFRAWEQLAGRIVRAHSRPEVLRDGVLIVATDTPAWAQELHMHRGELLAKLEAALGSGVVREIHFRSGFRARTIGTRPTEPRPAEIALSANDTAEIAQAGAHIRDPVLRAKAERAFTALTRITAWRTEQGWRRCGRCGQWQRTGKLWCASCLHERRAHER